jgi:hypothetical protein
MSETKAANFSKTGNIEIIFKGERHLIGQYIDGNFRLNGPWIVSLSSKYRSQAMNRLKKCSDSVVAHGKPEPQFIYYNFETGKPQVVVTLTL